MPLGLIMLQLKVVILDGYRHRFVRVAMDAERSDAAQNTSSRYVSTNKEQKIQFYGERTICFYINEHEIF